MDAKWSGEVLPISLVPISHLLSPAPQAHPAFDPRPSSFDFPLAFSFDAPS
jgi:hypothetical protein